MKALATQYSKHFCRHLSYFPAWQPGDPISPGEIGRLKKGVFYPEGPLTSIFPDLDYKIEKKDGTASMAFYSDSGISVSGDLSGTHPVGVKGKVRISFTRTGGVVFHAQNMELRYIENLSPLLKEITDRRKEWPKGYVLVSHVESADRYVVLISSSASWEVGLSGKASALAALQIADASVSVATVKGAGYERSGRGPVALRIYGLKVLGKHPRLLSADEPIPDGLTPGELGFEEISPFDPALDLHPGMKREPD
jgi:hypothetical protein